MYLLKNLSKLTEITLRGYFVSKKHLKVNRRQCLVFLRSPKHFNIGKQKVFSFNNKYRYTYSLSKTVCWKLLLFKNGFDHIFFLKNKKRTPSFKITSIKILIETSIKWSI